MCSFTKKETSTEAALYEMLEQNIIQKHYEYHIEEIIKILKRRDGFENNINLNNIVRYKNLILENYTLYIVNEILLPYNFETKLGEDSRMAYNVRVRQPDITASYMYRNIKFLFDIKVIKTGKNINSTIKNIKKDLERITEINQDKFFQIFIGIVIYVEE